MSAILMTVVLAAPTVAVLVLERLVQRKLRSTRYDKEVDE